jgi:hypothetical protein
MTTLKKLKLLVSIMIWVTCGYCKGKVDTHVIFLATIVRNPEVDYVAYLLLMLLDYLTPEKLWEPSLSAVLVLAVIPNC